MRSLRSALISGWVILILLATAGFAAFSTRGAADPAPSSSVAAQPELPVISGRVGAFILAESLAPPLAVAPAPVDIATADPGEATTSSTTTTEATTTTTEAPSIAEAPTTTAAPTTTQPAPPTTQAATTTTAAPTTTTTEVVTTTIAVETTEPAEETTTTTEAPAATASSSSGVEQWRGLVAAYFPAALVDEALSVMQCESRGDPNARNSYSGAAGLFQFMPRTWSWSSEGAGFGGADVYDPEANIAGAAWLVNYSVETGHSGGAWGHWNCKP